MLPISAVKKITSPLSMSFRITVAPDQERSPLLQFGRQMGMALPNPPLIPEMRFLIMQMSLTPQRASSPSPSTGKQMGHVVRYIQIREAHREFPGLFHGKKRRPSPPMHVPAPIPSRLRSPTMVL